MGEGLDSKIAWDFGTAYDLFYSLYVLYQPEEFGLRAAWAAGVRARLPMEARQLLEQLHFLFPSSVEWVYALPKPKDAATALAALAALPPAEPSA